MNSNEVMEHLEATISHLSTKRSWHLAEVSRLDDILRALHAEIDALPRTERIPPRPAQGQFSGISIRWAILFFFSERSGTRHTLGEIAEALMAGGASTKGQNFNSNVSAVLSVMVSKHELEKNEGKFSLTTLGQSIWEGIQKSEKFINRQKTEGTSEEE